MNGRVDEIERLSLGRQLLCFAIGKRARIREAAIDFDETIEACEILRRADSQQRVRVAHRRLAKLFELDAIRRLREKLKVLEDLRISRELAVGAWLEAEILFRSWDLLRDRRRCSGCDQQKQSGQNGAHPRSIKLRWASP